ncbi:probable H/ACA ribonucleoprotein complex subunit 1-like protein [Trichomycterus rosablanca]|uniref:probable H/ACA ribonucleoprotein complex subunit 1-like protein n=1 Tax=Trichomycterus rosablanca TaxID=2290929 RepID=UPI002F350A0A
MGDSEFSEPIEDSTDNSAEKIDMSLDEIIKLNKKEQKANRAAVRARNKRVQNKNNILKKLSETPPARRGFRRGALQYQGPVRSRGLNRGRGLGRGRGQSPLNRTAVGASEGEQQVQSTASSRGAFRGRARGRGRGRGGSSRGSFSARGRGAPQRGGRPFVLDRGFAATRGVGKLERYQKIKSQTPESTSGTMLTVSLPNVKPAPVTQVGPRRGGTALRGRSSEDVSGSLTPKGIPLHFNYKATTNQTLLSLNDRFTGLRMRGHDLRADGESGRGGRGRGRGRGGIRGGRGARRGIGGGIGGGIRGGGRGAIRGGMSVARGGRGRPRGRGGPGRTIFLQ